MERVDADPEVSRERFDERRDRRDPLQRDSAPYTPDQKDRDPRVHIEEPDS
jgi:hypothetical protein